MIATDRFEHVAIASASELRTWLEARHEQRESVWLVTLKKCADSPYVSTETILDEIVCFGWIDGASKKLPTARAVIASPAVASDLKDLDNRQYRGYVMYMALNEGGKSTRGRAKIDETSSVYMPTNEQGSAYIVTRTTTNRAGTMTVEYVCSCRDFLKNLRNGCKHTFCERLTRGEATTFGEPPARRPNLRAQRRPPRDRRGSNGLSMRFNQRHARQAMPARIPEMVDAMRKAEDRRVRDLAKSADCDKVATMPRRGGQMTTDSTRAAALILKVSECRSADEMRDRYRTYIERKVLALQDPPHPNTLSHWMNDATLEPLLMRLFHETTRVFRVQETVGIVDSTKLSDAETTTYRGKEYRGDDRPDARWLKCHVLSGLETNAILAFEFSDDAAHDVRFYKPLVSAVMRTFSLTHILADRAYLSEETLGWSDEQFGIKAVIPIKKKWDPDTKQRYYEVCREAVERYDKRRKEFDEEYRFRAKVEAVFSVIKRMFCGYLWSKGRPNEVDENGLCQAWRNETICKIIAYNLRCAVIQEKKTGVETNFLIPNRFFPAIPMELRAMQFAT